jgi:hypothetical protein
MFIHLVNLKLELTLSDVRADIFPPHQHLKVNYIHSCQVHAPCMQYRDCHRLESSWFKSPLPHVPYRKSSRWYRALPSQRSSQRSVGLSSGKSDESLGFDRVTYDLYR